MTVSSAAMTDPGTTVLDAVARRLEHDPDGPYLDFEGLALTAREADAASNRVAHALAELGVRRGDRVATLLENGPEQVLSFFGALKLGAIQVPINTAYKGEFLRHQLADSGARVVVVQGDFAARVSAVTDGLPELEAAIVVGPPDVPVAGVPAHGWGALLEAAPGGALRVSAVGPYNDGYADNVSLILLPRAALFLPLVRR